MVYGVLCLLLGCAEEAVEDTGDACAEVPQVAYENWGEGFLVENCQSCHASTAANRYGAPEGVSFDTVEEAWEWQDRILARAVEDSSAPMPPAGGVPEEDLQRLVWWFECAEEGT